jgi:catechol 2,3-dioxygenase-like lactoylglutathione lyase family enzyme
MPVRAVGINHIALEVDDLDAALDWYARWFEFRLRGRRETLAWIDLGDQFVALSLTSGGARSPDGDRHIGFVVDDKEALRAELLAAGEDVAGTGSLRMRDPSGNQLEIVDYRDVQFSKTDAVLAGMGLRGLEKSEQAQAELRAKGLIT